MLVIDASALTELLLVRPAAREIERQLAERDYDVHAPHLIDVEVLSALRRLVAAKETSSERAGQAIQDLLDLRLERYAHDILAPRVWALRENFSAYDGAYLALAELLADDGVPLLTADARLACAVHAHSDTEVILAG
jgi:predicted nucleic acid-binding protein